MPYFECPRLPKAPPAYFSARFSGYFALIDNIVCDMEDFESYIPEDKKEILEKLTNSMERLLSGDRDFQVTNWKGYSFLPGFSPETTEHAYNNVEYPKNSVFIVTFPKTGTNWTMEIVRHILYGHDKKLERVYKSYPFGLGGFEMFAVPRKFELCQYVPLPRLMFDSHLPEELVNVEKIKNSGGKIIVTLRNPKDQTVSLYHFMQKYFFDRIRERISSDWTEFLNTYVAGKLPLLTKEGEWYVDHLLGWYKRWWGDEDVLFLMFEDLKRNPAKEIRRVAEFVGVILSEERLEEIVEATSFKSMKDALDKGAKGDDSSADDVRKKGDIMRKGQVGEWKEMFTVAQSEMMDRLVDEKLGHTDIKFIYEL